MDGILRGGALRSRAPLIVTTALTLLADQASKAAALTALGEPVVLLSLLRLRIVRNSGGAFGILADAPLLFFFATLVIVAVATAWGWRSGQAQVPIGLIIGGGLGNLADRLLRGPALLRGEVVDFIDVGFWPVFNLADSAIVIGVALLILGGGLPERGPPNERANGAP